MGKKVETGIYTKVGLGLFEGECCSDTNQPLNIFARFVPLIYFCFSVCCVSITQYRAKGSGYESTALIHFVICSCELMDYYSISY